MSKADFDTVMEKGYNQAIAGKGMKLNAAFDDLRTRLKDEL